MSTYTSKAKAASANKKSLRKFLSTTALTAASIAALGLSSPAQADDLPPWAHWDHTTGQLVIDTSHPDFTNIQMLTDFFMGTSAYLSIPEGYTVNITGPAGSIFAALSANGADPTQILGSLIGHGVNIFISDTNGVIFGANSVVDVNGLIATTGQVSADQLQNNAFGNYTITNVGDDPNARIETHGLINIGDAGLAAFVAPTIVNSGIINARMGTVAFASGEVVTLDLYGDNLVTIEVPGDWENQFIEHTGEINAEGGTVVMSAASARQVVDNIINVEGIIDVSSATVQGGKIILSGGDNGTVRVAGELNASGEGGGEIDIRGQNVRIEDTANLYVDGGDYGNAGSITMIAQDSMVFNGNAYARGGQYGGNGGFVEVSGLGSLSMSGFVDTTAANGATGTLLIDPTDLYIDNAWAQLIAYLLLFNNVDLWATNSIVFTEDVDFSQAWVPFLGWLLTHHNLSVDAPLVRILGDMIFGAGNFYVNADVLDLGGRLYSRDSAWGTTSLMDGTRFSTTASWINVLSADALIQQAIDFAQNGATINVANDTYTENLTVNKDNLTLIGNGATIQSAGDSDYLITVLNSGLTIRDFILNGLETAARGVGGGLADYGIYAVGAGAQGLNVIGNTFMNFGEAGAYIANTMGGVTNFLNNIFYGSATRGIEFGVLGGGSVINIANNTFGSAGDELVNGLLFDHVYDATVNISGGTIHTGGSGGPQDGDGIHFKHGLGNGATVNIYNVGITSSDEAIDFDGDIAAGANVTISGGRYVGGNNGVEFDGIHGIVNIINAGIQGLNLRGINMQGQLTGALSIFGSTIMGYLDAIGSSNGNNMINGGTMLIDDSTLNSEAGDGIDIAGLNNATLTIRNSNIHAGGGHGIDIHGGSHASSVLIERNYINAYQNGVNFTGEFDGAGAFQVSDNYSIIAQNGHGIYIYDTTPGGGYVKIASNQEIGAGGNGIYIVNVNGASILSNNIKYAGLNGIRVDNSDDVTIGMNRIYNTNLHGIYMTGSNRAEIWDNVLRAIGWDGIHVSGGYGADIWSNTMSDIGRDGIDLENHNYADIYGNDISGTGGHGISISSSDHVDIYGNDISSTGGHGIDVAYSDFVNIGWNEIAGALGDGIHVFGGSWADIFGNQIFATLGDAIDVAYNFGVDIWGNTMAFIGGNGIEVTHSDYADIWNNAMSFIAGHGIYLGYSDHADITGNSIYLTGGHGIAAYNSDYLDIAWNGIHQAGQDGINVHGGSWADIYGNEIFGAGYDGIDVDGNYGLDIFGNLISGSGDNGIEVSGSYDAYIGWNTINYSGNNGIRLTNSAFADIRNNTVFFSGGNGIYASGSNYIDVVGNHVHGAGGDGIKVGNAYGVNISSNNVHYTSGDGIHVYNAGNITIGSNDIHDTLGHGIFAEHVGTIEILGNTLDTISKHGVFVWDFLNALIGNNTITNIGWDGIKAAWGQMVDISGNTIANTGDDGIETHNVDNQIISFNTITDATNNGVYVSGGYNGFIDFFGNNITFTTDTANNQIGLHVESGTVDLTGDTNFFTGGNIGMRFAGYDFGGGVFAQIRLVDDTLGTSTFTGQDDFYVQLANGALFDPDQPTIIDGRFATFDGITPITDFPLDENGNPIIPLDILNLIESKLFDFDDLTSIGQIFVGIALSLDNIEDFFREFEDFRAATDGLRVTLTGLPLTDLGTASLARLSPAAGRTTAQQVAGIEPAAGEGAQQGQGPEDIEPSAGGEETACWSDVVSAAGSGRVASYDFGGTFEESLSDAVSCGTQAL